MPGSDAKLHRYLHRTGFGTGPDHVCISRFPKLPHNQNPAGSHSRFPRGSRSRSGPPRTRPPAARSPARVWAAREPARGVGEGEREEGRAAEHGASLVEAGGSELAPTGCLAWGTERLRMPVQKMGSNL